MASFLQGGRHGRVGVAGGVVWLLATIPAAAQTSPLAPTSRIVLDRKRASNLVLAQLKPEYPPLAKHNFIQGQVRVQVFVTREGRVSEAHVVEGHPFLAAAALKAIRRWLYRPLTTRAGPTEFLTLVDLHFSLHTKKIEQFPRRPELDLNRQVRPPEILEKPANHTSAATVRLRVLVSDDGKVIDSQPVAGLPAYFDAARNKIEGWTFRPAYWGNFAVPWYVDVEVPVEDWPPPRPAGDPGAQ